MKFFFEKYDADKEQIYGEPHFRMAFNFLPGVFHALAPVNIIKNKNRIVVRLWKKRFKIMQGRGFLVIAIYKKQV